jgi:thiol-disulfide isomerase/thioredoxin
MPDSIALGPLLLPTQALLLLIATAAALGVLSLLRDAEPPLRARAEARLFIALVLGLLGARIGWVLRHWQAYADSPAALLAFRDGGYGPWIGLVVGLVTVLVMAVRQPGERRAEAAPAANLAQASPEASRWRMRWRLSALRKREMPRLERNPAPVGRISAAHPPARPAEAGPETERASDFDEGKASFEFVERISAAHPPASADEAAGTAEPHPVPPSMREEATLRPASATRLNPWQRLLLIPAAAGLSVLLAGQILLGLHDRASATPLPQMQVLDLDGRPQRLPTGQGRAQVINLWASWCAPCRREMPAFARVQALRPDVDFVYLNIGESPAEIAAFTRTLALPLAPIWRDPAGSVPERLQVRGYPTTLIVDGEGRLLHRRSGELSEASLKALLPPRR